VSETIWHVLGAGAVGCLFAERLSSAGVGVELILRDGAPASPITLERDGRAAEYRLPCSHSSDRGPIERLLITTKAYDVHAALRAVAHRLQPGGVVLLLTNGMGLAESLQREVPRTTVAAGTTTEAAQRLGPRHVRHTGRGETRLGARGMAEPPGWFRDWARAVANSRWEVDIDHALWDKLAINAVINPLTAVHRCHNGALAARPALREAVAALCREASQVSYAAGHTATARTLTRRVARVIAATAANRSSMLQDIDRGRPTEIDYITGYLLQVARRHGIPAAHHAALLRAVQALEP